VKRIPAPRLPTSPVLTPFVLACRFALRAWLLAALALAWPPTTQAGDPSLMRQAAHRLGQGAVAALPSLQAMLAEARAQDELHRLVTVNRFFNSQVAFRPDIEIWGQDDYWASPLQTLALGRGDCEDFVIAKYASLLAADVAMDRLRLVYVRARMPDQGAPVPHMVLAYYASPGAEPMILDNLRPEVMPASQRPDLAPVFSFNSAGLWQGVAGASAGDPMARLSRWRDVWQRTRQEGFP
jgi:predicted transglutaminase-like cysteine proteinase